MNQEQFKALSWLNSSPLNKGLTSNQEDSLQGSLDLELPFQEKEAKPSFTPQNFLVPGWKGEGLLSRPALIIKKSHKELIEDAKNQFSDIINRNSSYQQSVFNEFQNFLEYKKVKNHFLDSSSKFCKYISAQINEDIDVKNFIEVYAFRSVSIYIYKAKFLLTLAKKLEISLEKIDLHNPNSFLSRIFKTGSSTALNCESFKINQYSWYRPSSSTRDSVIDLKNNLLSVSTTEMIKIATYDLNELEYSHSYSHKAFGLFVNNLIIHFPKWIENEKDTPTTSFEKLFNKKANSRLETLLTKFEGNHLSSLGLSHWMAQENNVVGSWDQVICPDFNGCEFSHGMFTRICQEIHFLSFLVNLASYQGHEVLTLICSVMNDKKKKSATAEDGQMSFLGGELKDSPQVFDRIVLNLTTLPKKNPHHYFLAQVNNQLAELSKDGYLYVFSNQKLFVPSHSEKVEQLLKSYKVEAIFNFDQLQGRGEISNYLYVLRKRRVSQEQLFLDPIKSSEKESCLSFRWSGHLEIFKQFGSLVDEFETFMATRSHNSTPVFQAEPDEHTSFEFHQDAILDGLLLSSTSNDTSNITHPSFFKNLTKSCVPFDNFFQIETLSSDYNSSKSSSLTSDMLGISVRNEDRFPLLLIVNYTNSSDIKLELTTSDVYQAKLEQYGMAYFQYFGIIPKRSDINLNVFREYFNTQFGKQIIQLSLNGGHTKIKSKLRSLLIPSFFLETNQIPENIITSFGLFNLNSSEILNSHPEDLSSKFDKILPFLSSVEKRFPWHTMGMLSHFKLNLQNSLDKLEQTPSDLFKNPFIIDQLIKTPSVSIYPRSNDIFINTPLSNTSDIHKPLTAIESHFDGENSYVKLLSNENTIIELYTDQLVAQFAKFILDSAIGMPISSILQNLKIPSAADLKSIVSNHSELKESISNIESICNAKIQTILTSKINS
ncbi:hypothetical protein [Halobacteriovorax sp. HLS]|uniref:hypothetical protein n=1 Tax=Halobacteriovorax sp. HLS TaxID=2234000 RepID=UPI000FD9DC8C|nr:hypothetical protein [Halobacteriovorax sp. HLS]